MGGGGVLADYPDLEREDLLAALEFGALAAGGHHALHTTALLLGDALGIR